MVCIRTCDKCGMMHVVGGKCRKPMTPKKMHKWAKKQLKSVAKFEKQSRKSMKKDKIRIA